MEQCSYCNRVLVGQQAVKDPPTCQSCYQRLRNIRWFRNLTEPLRIRSEQRLIDGVELALDMNLPVNPADLRRYFEIIERRMYNNENQ